jgi:glycosyltransferase involved in cell wall biosynthesis
VKLGIDTFGANHGRSGLGTDLRSLVTAIPASTQMQVELFGPEIDRYTYTSERRDIPYQGLSLPDTVQAKRLWHDFAAPAFVRKQGYGAVLYGAGAEFLPSFFSTPGVALMRGLLSPLLAGPRNRHYVTMRKRLMRCAKIIASSQYIKRDLVNLGFDEDKIAVIYPGIDHQLFYPRGSPSDGPVVIKPFAIKRPYLIYPSRVAGPAKKHLELVKAFEVFKAKTGLPHRLVLAGTFDAGLAALTDAVSRSPYGTDIVITGYFPHQSMPLLLAHAEACVFPAAEEGVGLAALEALAAGIPLACAKAGALPETVGTEALYFNPDSPEDLAETIEHILCDRPLRDRLTATCTAWVQRYSWKTTAEATLRVLQEAAG